MTTTPTIWKSEFTANTGNTTGAQFSPVTIGLVDNRFLTIWVDNTNNVDNDAGTDIIGQIYDAEGNTAGGAFQLNFANFLDSENDPAVAALPDGGFVVVYEDNGTGAGGDADIRFERFNASGVRTTGGTIASGAIGGVVNSNPSIAVFANGDFVVSYQQLSGGDTDVIAKGVNGVTNVVGAALNAGQNSADVDANPDTVVLSNGNILTVYEEADGAVTGIEAQINTAAGALISNVQVANAGTDAHAAALAGGGYVVVWQDAANNGDIRAEIRNNTSGIVKGSFLVQGSANSENEAEVVGLLDGGFFVVWDDDSAGELRGQRFDALGAAVGSIVTTGTGGAITDPELGLTSDGRILVTFSNGVGEISEVILDPRDNIINGTNADEVLTTRIDSTTIFGGRGLDTIFGQGGNDSIQGGFATDSVLAGEGNDTIAVLEGEFIDHIDGEGGADTLDLSNIASRGANIDLLAGTWDLSPSFGGPASILSIETIIGTQGNDTVQGGSGGDRLAGGAGIDRLDGGTGADSLTGGTDDDIYIVDQPGDIIVEVAGEGTNDTVASPFTSYVLAAGIAVETLTTGNASGITDIDLTGNEFGQLILGNAAANRLDGKGGIDTLRGFAGNDTYIVDQPGDIIVEVAGAGTNDTVASPFTSYVLAAGIAVETLSTGNAFGIADIDLTGNEFGQLILGNAAANRLDGKGGIDTLRGFAGNDTYIVDRPRDIIVEVAGEGTNDTVASPFTSYVLAAGIAVETLSTGNAFGITDIDLTGNDFAQLIMGNAAANRLDGKGGIDTLRGFAGNDTYVVDRPRDIIVEVAGQGTNDTVISPFTSYVLAAGIVVETLSSGNAVGTTKIDLTGNEFGQLIMGNAAGNRLIGKEGIDTLRGFAGNDTLTGGAGADTLTSDLGNDIHDYNTITDSGTTVATSDSIVGFKGDRIDLATIDAVSGGANDAFIFRGTEAFTAAGQVRLLQAGADTIVEVNTVGTAIAEMIIILAGITATTLDAGDFVL